MTELRALQARFLDYLRHADTAIEADIAGGTCEERARRLSIYYNAYRMRLQGSIETDHPVLGVYLGDDGFERMASAYIDEYPSSETSLRNFCNSLPEFLRQRLPFSDFGVLSDLAAFERLLMEAFDAADAVPVNGDRLSTLAERQWPELALWIHPSVRSFVTQWNSVEIWQAIKAERTPPDALQGDRRAWLLWRNRARLTEFRSLPVDEYTVLMSAIDGENFAGICETLLEWHVESDVAARALSLLRGWIGAGIVIELLCDIPGQ